MNSYQYKTPENPVIKETSIKPLSPEQVKAHNAKPVKRTFRSKDSRTFLGQ